MAIYFGGGYLAGGYLAPLPSGDGYASGRPWPGVQIGGKDGKPLIFPFRGKCSPLASDDIASSIQVGGASGAPLQAFSLAQCDGSNLPSDTPLLGVQIGGKDGKPLVAGFCETCGGFFACECEICCTLTGTVQFPSVADPTMWSDAIDVELTCGETFDIWNGEHSCLNDEIDDDSIVVDQGITTYSGTSGTVLYDYPGYDDTPTDFTTDIWKSDEFMFNGGMYRLLYIATSFTYTTDVEHHACRSCVILQAKSDGHWCNALIAKGDPNGYEFGFPDSDLIESEVSGAPESECPPGYSENGGENSCGPVSLIFSYDTNDEENAVICPILIDFEALTGVGPVFTKNLRVMLADLCDEEEGDE